MDDSTATLTVTEILTRMPPIHQPAAYIKSGTNKMVPGRKNLAALGGRVEERTVASDRHYIDAFL